MTTTYKTIDQTTAANLQKMLIGFDRVLNSRYIPSSNYPPHNIIKYNETEYVIEVAVAGFSRDEITVDVEKNSIIVLQCRFHY